jgi:methylmalonyl-CoA/ethylmalonyl-CoA epimerase
MKKLHHIGIAVTNLDEGVKFYQEVLRLTLSRRETLEDRGIEIAFFPVGDTQLELIAPLNPESSFNKFLKKRGEGLHHLCFEVEDINSSAGELEKKGLILAEGIRPGSEGGKVCFFHPKSAHGVLLELKETD